MLRLIVGGRVSWTSGYTRSMYQRSFFVTSETNFRSVTSSNSNENRSNELLQQGGSFIELLATREEEVVRQTVLGIQ